METDSYAVLTVPGYQVKVRLLLADAPTLTAWWEGRRDNRAIHPRKVAEYRDAVLEKRWRLNGATIVLNQRGQMQDGQHRVRAMLDALAINPNLTIPLLVAESIEDSVFPTHDTGIKRLLAHLLESRRIGNSKTRAAIIPWLWRARHGYLTLGGYPMNPTPDEGQALYDEYEPLIDEAVQQGRAVETFLPRTLGGALWILFGERSPEARDRFWHSFATGAMLNEGDPVYALRRLLLTHATAKRRLHVSYVTALVIKAWNAYRAGRPIALLSFRVGEAYPEIE